jgi:hypothetical protein
MEASEYGTEEEHQLKFGRAEGKPVVEILRRLQEVEVQPYPQGAYRGKMKSAEPDVMGFGRMQATRC